MAPIPNSESSSFTESVSRYRPFSPSMQPSKANNPPGEITPSTSFSAPSSQELPPENPETLSGHVPVQQAEGQTHVRVSPIPSDVGYPPQTPTSPASVLPEARKVPNKRMANGEVKKAMQSPLSPVGQQMRSNKTSVTSRNVQISEASSHCLQKEIDRNIDCGPSCQISSVPASPTPWLRFKMVGKHTALMSLKACRNRFLLYLQPPTCGGPLAHLD